MGRHLGQGAWPGARTGWDEACIDPPGAHEQPIYGVGSHIQWDVGIAAVGIVGLSYPCMPLSGCCCRTCACITVTPLPWPCTYVHSPLRASWALFMLATASHCRSC